MENEIAQPRVRRKHRSLAQELVTFLGHPNNFMIVMERTEKNLLHQEVPKLCHAFVR